MIELEGFHQIQILGGNSQMRWLQAIRTADEQVCHLKLLPAGATPGAMAGLKREFELLREIRSPHIVQALELMTDQGRSVLVLSAPAGQPLFNYLNNPGLTLQESLQFAIHCSQALVALLNQRLVHKNLNPKTLWWSPSSQTVCFTGFEIAQRLRQDGSELQRSHQLEGDLPYISLEQTGRSNRLVDYRSDYYSLGIILYQLLTGQVPFTSNRRLEVVAAHLSRQPKPPHEVNPAIPEMVSQIVLKLLEKAAEDRYQNPLKLKADLETCLQQVSNTGIIEPFDLGQGDRTVFFQPLQKLYGRDPELSQLHQAFNHCVTTGQPQVVAISGPSGVGKSWLAQELQRPVSSQQGNFMAGKSMPMKRATPYSAIAPVLGKLIRRLLTEGEAQVDIWRRRLQAAVGRTGQVIVPILPELELLLGPQPPVPQLPDLEQQNRLRLTFLAFVQSCSTRAQPLVLFLDDLQWVDDASLQLLQALLTDPDTHHLLVIGSFRDDEVDGGHALSRCLNTLDEMGVPIKPLKLLPIDLKAIVALTADTLSANIAMVYPLAEIIQQKTNGIPFFVNVFLKQLWATDVLVFGPEGWTWDLEQVRLHQATQNVVEAMASELNQLPEATLEVLKPLACLGNRVHVSVFQYLLDDTHQDVVSLLEPALMTGLLYRENDTLSFSHDRIRETVYDLVSQSHRDALHIQLGRQLWAYYEQANCLQEHVFEVVGHLNPVQAELTVSERYPLAKLNQSAGDLARNAVAYDEALTYYLAAITSLGETGWQHHYDLVQTLHFARLECEYLTGHYDTFESVYAELLTHLKSPLDRVRLCRLKVTAYINQGRLKEAVEVGTQALEQDLGINVPTGDFRIQSRLLLEVFRVKLRLQNQDIARLTELPEMTDETKRCIVFLMAELFPAAFVSNPKQFVWMVCYLTRLCLKYGKCNITAQVFLPFTQVLGGALKDYDSAYQFGQLALQLNQQYANVQLDSKLRFMFTWFCNHWKSPAQDNLEIALLGYQKGREYGDLVFASYNLLSYFHTHLTIGTPLNQVAQELQDFKVSLRRMNEQLAIFYNLHCFTNVVRSLQGDNADPLVFEHIELPEYAEDLVVQTLRDRGQLNLLMFYWLYKVELMVIFGQSDQAIPLIDQMLPIQEAVMGELAQAEVNFYHSLVLADQARNSSPKQRQRHLKALEKNQKLMRLWASHSPSNFIHKRDLIDAEIAGLRGDRTKAQAYYQTAIATAQAAGYIQNEALAYERGAQYYLQSNNSVAAMGYLLKAVTAYQRWGASAKVKALQHQYRQLFSSWQHETEILAGVPSQSSSLMASLEPQPVDSLDTETLVSALSTVSREIKLENLRTQFLKLVVENSGGERGFLIQEQAGALVIVDSIDTQGQTVYETEGVSVSDCPDLSQSIIYYVLRAQESVVVQDLATDELFGQDFASLNTRSVLCLPIMHQGRLLAIVYLDNALASGIFTPSRLRLLKLLSAQAGISLENALLYQNLEHKVAERTTQLLQANQEISELNERLQSENLRMSAELEVTRKLQQMILPRDQELQQIEGLDIVGFMEPAAEVGGDYYDVLSHDGHIKIGIGDVTGHGLESGVLMLMMQTAVRTLLINNESNYVKFWDTLNRVLYENIQRMDSELNMTLTLLDYQTGSIRFSGQHEEMLIIHPNGRVERFDTLNLGLPLGLVSDITEFINQSEINLQPGGGIVLYTDGITEAPNANKDRYGLERLCQVVSQSWQHPAHEIRRLVIDDVRQHIGDFKVYDDISLLIVKQIT